MKRKIMGWPFALATMIAATGVAGAAEIRDLIDAMKVGDWARYEVVVDEPWSEQETKSIVTAEVTAKETNAVNIRLAIVELSDTSFRGFMEESIDMKVRVNEDNTVAVHNPEDAMMDDEDGMNIPAHTVEDIFVFFCRMFAFFDEDEDDLKMEKGIRDFGKWEVAGTVMPFGGFYVTLASTEKGEGFMEGFHREVTMQGSLWRSSSVPVLGLLGLKMVTQETSGWEFEDEEDEDEEETETTTRSMRLIDFGDASRPPPEMELPE